MKTVELGELVAPAQVKRAGSTEYPVLSMTMHDGLVAQTERFKKRIASLDTSGYKVVRHGQLVVGFPINEGVLDFQLQHEAAVVSPAYGVWDLRDESLADRAYLKRFLKSPRAIEYYDGKMKGSTARRRSLPPAEFNAMPIPLPPIPEQRRIAAILDHADALRAKRRLVLTHLDALTQSIFHDMFGNASTTVPLSDLVEGFRYGTSNKSGDTGFPTLRIPNVIGGGITTAEIKTVEVRAAELGRLQLCEGDLLFVRTNGNHDNVGRCAVFSKAAVQTAGFGDQPWIYASYLIRARLTAKVLPSFVATYLATPQGRKQLRERSKTSAGQYNINVESLSSVVVPAVPFAEQCHFASCVETINANRERLRTAASADDVLFASLQSRAFRGEL